MTTEKTDSEKMKILLDCVQFIATARPDETREDLLTAALETLESLGIEPMDPTQFGIGEA